MITTDSFRHDVENYLQDSGMTATDFGRLAVGDCSFILQLRRGRSPRLKTVEKVLVWIDENPLAEGVRR